MKTCKTGCGKMKAGGSIKKMAKGGQALNKAKGFAKPTTGGDNVSKQIYGVPNAGPTGPNRTGTYDYKKGGSVKKYQDGGDIATRKPALSSRGAKVGVGTTVGGMLGVAAKAIADKVKAKKAAKKTEEEKKKSETPQAKFGSSVDVQRGYPHKIRSAKDQGYTAVGEREPERTKFKKMQKGGSLKPVDKSANPGLAKLPTEVRNKMGYAKKGGNWIQGAIKKPGALREQLGVKEGEKIPKAKLAAAAKKGGKLGQRARLAITLSKMHKK